jgi:putative SOS response-associated peptidase YedK
VLVPRYNVAPSTPVLGLRNAAGDEAEFMTWGPHLINARAETLATRPSFAQALRFRRAVVFADGYYEWQHQSGMRKQPYRVTLASGQPFAFAALWEQLPVPDDGPRFGCTLVTRDARADLAWVHDRMPVILNEEGTRAWLEAHELPAGCDADVLSQTIDGPYVATAVSRAVNKPVGDDDPSLIVPVSPPVQDSLF